MEIAGQEYQWCHWSTKVSCPEEPADGKQHVLPARFFKTKESWRYCNVIQQNRGKNNQNLISQSHTSETLRGNPPRNESIQVVRSCVYMSICSITLFPNGTLCFAPQR